MIEVPSNTGVSAPETIWQVRPPAPPEAVERLVRELGVPPLLAAMLWNRGFRGDTLPDLRPPLELSPIPTLAQAAGRIEEAIRQRRRILLHGDYDADGVTGTAVLLLGLRALGAQATAFIPHRLNDGYGVHPERIDEHASRCDLFITVDCGISNLDEVERLRQKGVEVIVTDHHQPGEVLPDCLVVHPKLVPDADGQVAELTGAGVAYHLLWALHERMGLEEPLEFSDIATIGTIADVAPLLGVNRALVRAGLERLPNSRWPGLRASAALWGLRGDITARGVAFAIAPRLNAAGRLGEADKALELLTTASERRARELAAYLDARNQDRRKIQDEMYEDALVKVDQNAPALVLDDDAWHPGVMGIVASKLVERFYKPVFIIAQGKGSVRSTPGISAVHALRSAGDHLLRYGGHSQAAGFAIAAEKIGSFRQAIYEFVSKHPVPTPSLSVDAIVNGEEIDAELFRAMGELEPYGEGHPAPLLALTDRLEQARAVGRDGATLQLRVGGLRGVAWSKGELAGRLRTGELVNAAVSVREREWQGVRQLEFVAQEVRPLLPFALALEAEELATATAGIEGVVRRGTPRADGPEVPANEAVVISRLAAAADPLETLTELRQLLRQGRLVYIDLDAGAVTEARQAARLLPTVADVRRGFVSLQRGSNLPFAQSKSRLVRQVLTELDLLDSLGRVRRGEKRDPHSSPTLLRSLVERYRLISLLNAYLAFDDDGFSLAAGRLLA